MSTIWSSFCAMHSVAFFAFLSINWPSIVIMLQYIITLSFIIQLIFYHSFDLAMMPDTSRGMTKQSTQTSKATKKSTKDHVDISGGPSTVLVPICHKIILGEILYLFYQWLMLRIYHLQQTESWHFSKFRIFVLSSSSYNNLETSQILKMESTCKEEEQPFNKAAAPSNQDDIIKMLISITSQMMSNHHDLQDQLQ